jgi:hypothetical protein
MTGVVATEVEQAAGLGVVAELIPGQMLKGLQNALPLLIKSYKNRYIISKF